MNERSDLLRKAMLETGTSQSELARISGVRQPSISQALSGRIEISDDQLDRLLSCLGYQLQVTRQAHPAELTRSERRSWLLHRHLAPSVDEPWLRRSAPTIRSNLSRLTAQTHGEPHTRNLKRWSVLLRAHDVGGIRRLLTGLDRDAIEMREVSPLGGLLSDDERRAVLIDARR